MCSDMEISEYINKRESQVIGESTYGLVLNVFKLHIYTFAYAQTSLGKVHNF